MKIKSVIIQGLHHVKFKQYDFKDVNYLYGPNGAGKSTVLSAVQLAILGYIPGSAKTKASVLSHRGQGDLVVTVVFDDDSRIERSWRGPSGTTEVKNTTPYEDPLEIVGNLELPIFNFGELVGLTANKLKDWFIQFLPTTSQDINWEKELDVAFPKDHIIDEDLLSITLEQIKILSESSPSTLELVRNLNEYLKSEQAFYKKELTQFESTIQSLIYYDEEGITGDEQYINTLISESQQRIKQYTSEKEKFLLDQSIIESNKSVQSQLDTLPQIPEDYDEDQVNQAIETAKSNLSVIEEETKKIQSKIMELNQINSGLKAEINTLKLTTEGGGVCPYTSEQCSSIESLIEKLNSDIEDKETTIKTNTATIQELQDKQSEITKNQQTYQDIIRNNQNYITQVQSAISRKQQLESLLKPEPDMSNYSSIDKYTSLIEMEQQKITKLEANKRYNQLIEKFTADKFRTENSIEVLKKWIKLTDANGLQSRLMNQSFYDFAEEMDKYVVKLFPGDVTCGFDLQEKANSFSFGIYRNNQYIKYELLSSGEKTIYTLAMMLCIISKSSSNLKLLIVDDMLDHLDDDRANLIFEGLKRVEGIQIITAGVKGSDHLPDYTILI